MAGDQTSSDQQHKLEASFRVQNQRGGGPPQHHPTRLIFSFGVMWTSIWQAIFTSIDPAIFFGISNNDNDNNQKPTIPVAQVPNP